MEKNANMMQWSYGGGEVEGSYNAETIAAMSLKDFQASPMAATFFTAYSDAAKDIRIKALHGAAVDKMAAVQAKEAKKAEKEPVQPAKDAK